MGNAWNGGGSSSNQRSVVVRQKADKAKSGQKEIHLDDLRVSVAGHIDPARAFGISTDTRAGFSKLSVRVEAASKLTEAEMEDFRLELVDRCPLCDTIGSPTPLQISLAG